MAGRTYSTRVVKFRRAVFAARTLSPSTKVLLLRMSDDMSANAIVSIPRNTLADSLGVAPARITEGIKSARQNGYLSLVRRGRPGITSVYQGLSGGTGSVPLHGYAPPDQEEVRNPYPYSGPDGGLGVRQDPTQEGYDDETAQRSNVVGLHNTSIEEQADAAS